jgi:hypothetical protein
MQDAYYQVVGYTMHDTSDFIGIHHILRITISVIAVLAFAVCLFAVPVMAHAPADMSIRFDPNTAKIYITITHPVDDPATHYLKTVRVKLNGRVISDPDYKNQPTKDTFTYTYDVNANPGDSVWVTAICVQGGTLEKSYEVPQPVSPATRTQLPATIPLPTQAQAQPPATVPLTARASLGLLPLLGAAAGLILKKR